MTPRPAAHLALVDDDAVIDLPAETVDGDPVPVPPATPPAAAEPTHQAAGSGAPTWRTVAALVLVVALLAVIFQLGVTSVIQSREQAALLRDLQADLGAAGTIAPTVGSPLGLLDIPSIGVSQVVVEGTEAHDLQRGPGHDHRTALPGAAGAALIVGKSTTYGGPFGSLDALDKGDRINLTTALGRMAFTVVAGAGEEAPAAKADASRLVLRGGSGLMGTDSIDVVADLDGPASPDAPAVSAPVPTDAPPRGSWLPLVLWLELLVVALVAAAWLYRRWPARAAYVASTPVVVAILFGLFGAANLVLPPLW